MKQYGICLILSLLLLSGCERKKNTNSSTLDSAVQKANEGRATEMSTQEMDAYREKEKQDTLGHKREIESRKNSARAEFTDKEMEIHRYMKSRWDTIAESASGYDPDVHDDLVLGEAASKFSVSKEEAQAIYIKIDLAGLNL